MLIEKINQILSELNCSTYTYNQENYLIEKNNHSGSFTYGLSELIDITNELNANDIKYDIDENENIIIIE